MSSSSSSDMSIECSSGSHLCRIFSRDEDDSVSSFQTTTATPDLSWDETSSSNETALRSCMKIVSQEDSLKLSYYGGGGRFEPFTYRVEFSTETVYYHDLTVQELRGPRNEPQRDVRPHSISMYPDPWKVTVSPVPQTDESTTCKQRKQRIVRWSRSTREDVWLRYCQESKLEDQQRMSKELRLAEKDLTGVTNIDVDTDRHDTATTGGLEQTLDAIVTASA